MENPERAAWAGLYKIERWRDITTGDDVKKSHQPNTMDGSIAELATFRGKQPNLSKKKHPGIAIQPAILYYFCRSLAVDFNTFLGTLKIQLTGISQLISTCPTQIGQ